MVTKAFNSTGTAVMDKLKLEGLKIDQNLRRYMIYSVFFAFRRQIYDHNKSNSSFT